ncbi:hypothetical protein GW17_00031825, partial [Ensete ventricosum]
GDCLVHRQPPYQGAVAPAGGTSVGTTPLRIGREWVLPLLATGGSPCGRRFCSQAPPLRAVALASDQLQVIGVCRPLRVSLASLAGWPWLQSVALLQGALAPFGAGPKAIAAVELLTINEKLNVDLDKAGLQLDTSDKELNDTHNLLIDSQKQIKDLLARGQKTNDDLLEAIRELDALRAELPCKAVEEYKEMAWFKLGLRQIGQVSYKYGY